MPRNVRKSRSDRSAKSLATAPDIQHIPAKRQRKPAPVVDEAEEVRRRIEHLECVITASPAEQIARGIAVRDTLPALEKTRRPRHDGRRPSHVEERSRNRSLGLLAQALVLAVVIAGVAGWLNQRFHFMPHL